MSHYDDDDDDDRPRKRRRRDDDDDDDRPRDNDDDRRRPRRPADTSNGMAVMGLVLGLLSVIFGCLTGVPAIICSAMGMKKTAGKGMAIAGLIFGTLGTLWTIGAVALILPAVQKMREAQSRVTESNNFKQIAVGINNYHDTNALLPAADGKLSWRVEILPYLEQENLYRQFNLQQAWDSPANLALANTKVKVFLSPSDPPETTETRYRVFVGRGTLYEPGRRPLSFGQVTDGISNTLFCIEATDSVPWTQPKELQYSAQGPLPPLGRKNSETMMFAMCDGSVRSVRIKNVDDQTLRALITPAGEERFKFPD